MIKYITGDTLANTVRMGARSRRPKAVFLASDKADVELVQALLSTTECRLITAHSRENAIEAFDLLVKSGYTGVFTAVNTQFAPAHEQDVFAQDGIGPSEIVEIEGVWEDIQSKVSLLAGQRVRVTFVSNPADRDNENKNGHGHPSPNERMLNALQVLYAAWKDMIPKQDNRDFLREARAGAMYGSGDDA